MIDTSECLTGFLRDKGYQPGTRFKNGFSNGDWTLKKVCQWNCTLKEVIQTRYGLWQAMSIEDFVVGTKTSCGPISTMTGMKFSKHGYPSRDSLNLYWVFQNKSKGKVLAETTVAVNS